MTVLDWYAEQFSPTGNLTSEGARRQLGRSHLDPLDLLVRETMQNSWDARLPDKQMSYQLDLRKIYGEQASFLKDHVFRDGPPNIDTARIWTDPDASVLIVSDRGTSGLTGPLRADQVTPETAERDLVDFVFNLGQPRNTDFGGGTYGYGKTVLYNISRINTVLVHTRTRYNGAPVSRLIGVGLGAQYDNHTGRHWWGRRTADGVIEPLTGTEADEVAARLAFPGFGPDDYGTSLMIMLPEFGTSRFSQDDEDAQERTPEEFLATLAVSYAWNFWPKLLDRNPRDRKVNFSVRKDGADHSAAEPNTHPAFFGFRHAMAEHRKARGNNEHRPEDVAVQVSDIECFRPKKHLGILSLVRFPMDAPTFAGQPDRSSYLGMLDRLAWSMAPFTDICSHVALMRDAELVVRYEIGPPVDQGHYAGIFVTDRDLEVDHAYAASEPPAHDDWEPSGLSRPASTYVTTGLRRIGNRIDSFANPGFETSVPEQSVPLGGISERLAGLVAVSSGPGVEIQRLPGVGRSNQGSAPVRTESQSGDDAGRTSSEPARQGTGSAPPMRLPRLNIAGAGKLEIFEGRRALRVKFKLDSSGSSPSFGLRSVADIKVADETTSEADAPLGGSRPEVLAWLDESGARRGSRPDIHLVDEPPGEWAVVVSIPDDCVVEVSLLAFRIEDQ